MGLKLTCKTCLYNIFDSSYKRMIIILLFYSCRCNFFVNFSAYIDCMYVSFLYNFLLCFCVCNAIDGRVV